MPETPRDFTVKVFSIKGARQTDRKHVVRMQVDDESPQRLTCPGDGLEKVRELNGSGRGGGVINKAISSTFIYLHVTVTSRLLQSSDGNWEEGAAFLDASKGKTH